MCFRFTRTTQRCRERVFACLPESPPTGFRSPEAPNPRVAIRTATRRPSACGRLLHGWFTPIWAGSYTNSLPRQGRRFAPSRTALPAPHRAEPSGRGGRARATRKPRGPHEAPRSWQHTLGLRLVHVSTAGCAGHLRVGGITSGRMTPRRLTLRRESRAGSARAGGQYGPRTHIGRAWRSRDRRDGTSGTRGAIDLLVQDRPLPDHGTVLGHS